MTRLEAKLVAGSDTPAMTGDRGLLDGASAGKRVNYGRVIPGMMIGAVTASAPWRDYRGGTLPPGT